MDKTLFSELLESAKEALEHAKGKRDLRTTVLPAAPKPMSAKDVRRLRSRLKASQAVFASYLNVSTKLVQAWESDRRTPEGAALRLLRIAEKAPEVLLSPTAAETASRKAGKRMSNAPVRKRAARGRSA